MIILLWQFGVAVVITNQVVATVDGSAMFGPTTKVRMCELGACG